LNTEYVGFKLTTSAPVPDDWFVDMPDDFDEVILHPTASEIEELLCSGVKKDATTKAVAKRGRSKDADPEPSADPEPKPEVDGSDDPEPDPEIDGPDDPESKPESGDKEKATPRASSRRSSSATKNSDENSVRQKIKDIQEKRKNSKRE
jgi:hypothetical protein